jgi:hypothetical protein
MVTIEEVDGGDVDASLSAAGDNRGGRRRRR